MSADRFERITEIVKERYQTGAYGMAHFRMPRSVLEAATSAGAAPKPRQPWEPNLDALLAIPIVIDETLGPDEWQLVHTLTKEVLEGSAAHREDT